MKWFLFLQRSAVSFKSSGSRRRNWTASAISNWLKQQRKCRLSGTSSETVSVLDGDIQLDSSALFDFFFDWSMLQTPNQSVRVRVASQVGF